MKPQRVPRIKPRLGAHTPMVRKDGVGFRV